MNRRGSGKGPVSGSCEHGHEASGFMKNLVFFYDLVHFFFNCKKDWSSRTRRNVTTFAYVCFQCRSFPWFHCTIPKSLIRKRCYVLFLIPVLIVQVTKLVHFTQHNSFSKSPPSTPMHFAARVRTVFIIFGICEDVRHFSRHSYNVTINSYNGQLTLHSDSYVDRRTILGAKSKLLYSEIALSRKPFGI
jgi:hypothetical protein